MRLEEEYEAVIRLEALGEMVAEWEVLREERLGHHRLLINTYEQALAYMNKHEGIHRLWHKYETTDCLSVICI